MKALRTCFGMAPATALLLLLTTVIAVAWFLPVDCVDDDMAYRRVVTAVDYPCLYGNCEGPEIDGLGDALTSCAFHYRYVYGRLADKFVILSTLLPQWLANSLCGISIGVMAWLIVLCGGTARRPWLAGAAILLMWLLLPWYDLHFERAYIFNYVVTSCMLLGCIYLYNIGKGRGWIFVIAFAAGMSQEIFGTGLLLWLFINLICSRNRSRRQSLITLAAFSGWLIMLLSPGAWARFFVENAVYHADGESVPYLVLLRMRFSRLLMALMPMIICIVPVLYALIRRRMSWRQELPWLALPLCSTAMALLFLEWGRFLWMGYVAAIILLMHTAACLSFPPLKRIWRISAASVAIAVYCLWGAQLANTQRHISHAQHDVNRRLASGAGYAVENDMPDWRLLPWYVAALVVPNEGRYPNVPYCQGMYFGYGDSVVYIPRGFSGKPIRQWPRLPGANNIYGADGRYYTPACNGKPALEITYGEYLPAASPADRLFGLLRGYSNAGCKHPALNFYTESGKICGEPVYAVYLGEMPRGLDSRQILRVDTI
ncbi:MAG: hypothetical protein K2F74_03770, partial [Muribaculaceae bacterium]|nr:hypothetical protein [Muribaculaceae bacterium]